MTKTHGMGAQMFVGGYNVSGDIGSLSRISGSRTVLPVTAIDKSAMERLLAGRDGGMDFTAFFNPAADQAHPVLKTLPTTDVICTYLHGQAIGNPGACMVAKQINYDPTRGDDGSFIFTTQTLANTYGLEWGEQATAGVRTDSSATVGSAMDSGAATTNFGLQAYLHAFSIASGTATVKLQESSDNGADTYADVVGGAFSAVTGRTSQRIATATNLAVERYLKVTTTGTFTDLVFAVVVVRNIAAPIF